MKNQKGISGQTTEIMASIGNQMKRKYPETCHRFVLFLAAIVFFISVCSTVAGQKNTSANSNTNQAVESPSPTPAPTITPIPVVDIGTLTQSTERRIEQIKEAHGKESPILTNIETELPKLTRRTDSNLPETTLRLSSSPSLESIRIIEMDWKSLFQQMEDWKKDLKTLIGVSDDRLNEVGGLIDLWTKTLNSLDKFQEKIVANSAGGSNNQSINSDIRSNSNIDSVEGADSTSAGLPSEVLAKIRAIISSLNQTKKMVDEERAKLLSVQTRLIKAETRIEGVLTSIEQARQGILSSLFVRDSPAIWNAHQPNKSPEVLFRELFTSLDEQAGDLREYSINNSENYLLHGLVILFLSGLFYWMGRRMKSRTEDEPELKKAFAVFDSPVLSAVILSVLFARWFYPLSPRILTVFIGIAVLIPVILFMRRILDKSMFAILTALGVLFFIDLIREATVMLTVFSRVSLLMEITGACIFLIWFLRRKTGEVKNGHSQVIAFIRTVIPVLLILFAISLAANILGYVRFATIIGNGVLGSAYVAFFLYTVVQLLDMLLVFALRMRPLTFLKMVKTHRQLLHDKIYRIVQWAAVIAWGWRTLGLLSVRGIVYDFFEGILTAEFEFGEIGISLGDVIIFAVTVWLAFAISRVIRFVLEEDVYPRLDIAGGVSYALSVIIHYLLLLVGFVLAIASLGLDLTKFTILAGAFGVGLGFGLQNIVNNFVSGLILLFERPVKINDFVKVGTNQGELTRIGLRASVLRTLEGSEIIVPNGQLISGEVTNWTFSDERRRIDVNVGVAYGSNPRKVAELLKEVAVGHDRVLDEPAPRVVFVGFGESSLDFQIWAWIAGTRSDDWVVVRSDLALAVHDRLDEAGIKIPFPQRDLHLKDIEKDMVKKFRGKESDLSK